MGAKRRRLRARALRKSFELKPVVNRAEALKATDILCFATLRNEKVRLEYFLQYYRKLGVNHFLIVDNDSNDGSREYLAEQPDVSLWRTPKSYKRAQYGADWLNYLLFRYGRNHWCVTVDVDEFLVYPFCDTRGLGALTDWLDTSSIRSFSAMQLDMYPKGPLDAVPYRSGQDPFEIANWFDSGNYTYKMNQRFGNLWIQGGPRARYFFPDEPENAPALNKIPLVKWKRGYVYCSSTHMLLPRGLNLVYESWGGEKTSGCLMHAKFLDNFEQKAKEELVRKEHFSNSVEYRSYAEGSIQTPDLWTDWSEKYINWRQLEILGLMSKGNWA